MSGRSMTLQTGISWILRVGVILSVIFEGSGLLMEYLRTGTSTLCIGGPGCDTWRVAGGNFFNFAYSTFGSIAGGLSATGLISMGIVILMFTPYFRIAAAVVYYTVEKDWKYVLITFFVFLLITTALLIF